MECIIMNNPDAKNDITKNVKVVFTVNTARDYFIDWLAEKTILANNSPLKKALKQLPNAKFSSGLKLVGIHPEEQQTIIIDQITKTDGSKIEGKIFFKILTIGKDRIEVSAGFIGDTFPLFSRILLAIARTFLESADAIVHYLESLMPIDNAPEILAGKISKKGPHKYSDEEKLKALRDWDKLDKSKYPTNICDWLIERFGESGGVPNVHKSTFYGWKKPLKDKGLLD